MALSASVQGTVAITQPYAVGRIATGVSMVFDLLLPHKGPTEEHSSTRRVISSPGSYVSLALPSGFLGQVLYLRNTTTTTYALRLTTAVTGTQVLANQRGTVLLEFDPTDYLTQVEVQGEVTLEYAATGLRT